jgi:RND family efflux transporter MFP subunit
MLTRLTTTLALSMLVLSAGCGGDAQTGAAPQGPPPVPVQLKTLSPSPVDDATEYVSTIKSLRSTSVRPQVDGIIRRIHVKSGDRVRPGTPLMQIDAQRQQAALSSQSAARAAREADLALARTELERARTLYAGGAISKQELDQAETRVKSGEAELASLTAQVREARVQLQYFQVSAPAAGIVGDIPVRVGNRVTSETELTTINENASLEVHVAVPLERATDLAPGLPIEIIAATGKPVARTTVSFISSRADDGTQSVLVKGRVDGLQTALRSDQYVRARIIWKERQALLVPVVAIVRVGAQNFLYVAEGQQGKLVARQRGVTLGPVVGNDYVIEAGLKPGDRVVVEGAQKLIDGAPIAVPGAKPQATN